MTPNEYQQNCLKTEHTPNFIVTGRGEQHDRMLARLMHAMLGLMSEVGEIADQLKRHLIYSKDLDLLNILEEDGDSSWYKSLLLDAIGSSWEESWAKNIAKLRARFPQGFSEEKALNRDLDAERRALEK